MYSKTVGKGVAYHFFVSYARIDCDLADRYRGKARKDHLKAYGDLMYLLTERKALVEQYFCFPISESSFQKLCNELYCEGHESCGNEDSLAASDADDINTDKVHLPYSLGCDFSDEAISILYKCFVSEGIFKNITEDEIRALFDGTLSTEIKCHWGVRLGYILHQLAVAGLITKQYQAAIARCGYVIAPGCNEPMSAVMLKDAVKRAKVYSEVDNTPWKRTINKDLKRLFELMGVEIRQRNRVEA